ncbi:MAG TPA: MMPL family transporter, partial [Microbacterium sp.]|uniref:MMPL family transporter n=1 Tax=Microbacterium sp. TaxID=51671 RepID=UPI002B60A407
MADPKRRSLREATPRSTTRWLRIGVPALLILVWLVAGAIGGPYFGRVDEVSTNDQSSFLPESADATRVADLLPQFLGVDGIPAVIVATAEGQLNGDELTDLQSVADAVARLEGVSDGVSPPIVSEDGEAAQIFVPIKSGEARETVDSIRSTVQAGLPDGVDAWVTGPAGFTADLVTGFLGIDGLLLGVALGAV